MNRMDLEKELQKEQTKERVERIIEYIGDDKERFAILVNLFFKGEYRMTQHAGWPLSFCVRHYPTLAKPYYKKFIDKLSDREAHIAARRNIVRLFQFVDVPEKYQGSLMDACFQFISDPQEAIAVKAFSLTVLDNLSKTYPEILPEIKSIIDARWQFETSAFRTRARKILSRFNEKEPSKDESEDG